MHELCMESTSRFQTQRNKKRNCRYRRIMYEEDFMRIYVFFAEFKKMKRQSWISFISVCILSVAIFFFIQGILFALLLDIVAQNSSTTTSTTTSTTSSTTSTTTTTTSTTT